MAPPTPLSELVTRPLDELAGCVWESRGSATSWQRREDLSLAVGSQVPEPQASAPIVLLTIAPAGVPLAELHLSPADALLLAGRLVRMAAAVHAQSSTLRHDE